MNGFFILLFWAGFMLQSSLAFAQENDSPSQAGHPPDQLALGSPIAEVINLLGEPSRRMVHIDHEETWTYGTSILKMQHDKVHGWINSGDPDLPVFLGDKIPEAPPFQKGSAPEVVIAAMGTPDTLIQLDVLQIQNWYYGTARVTLVNGKVDSWQGSGLHVLWDVAGMDVEKSLVTPPLVAARTNMAKSSPAARPNSALIRPMVRLAPIPTNQPVSVYSAPSRRYVTPLPSSGAASGGRVYVRGYTRKDGTVVKGHYRNKPRR